MPAGAGGRTKFSRNGIDVRDIGFARRIRGRRVDHASAPSAYSAVGTRLLPRHPNGQIQLVKRDCEGAPPLLAWPDVERSLLDPGPARQAPFGSAARSRRARPGLAPAAPNP